MKITTLNEIKQLLESQTPAYVIHQKRSWDRLLERVRVAKIMQESAEEQAASQDRWWREEILPELHFYRDRCTFLYAQAIKHGATVEELRQREPKEGRLE